jgi:hypothetical protein
VWYSTASGKVGPVEYDNLHKHPMSLKQRRDQALATLRGVIEGISADGYLKESEIDFCNHWMHEHERLAQTSPFREMFLYIRNAMVDGIITTAERDEILFGIESCGGDDFFDVVTQGLQELQGIMSGVASDGHVNEHELREMRHWMEEHDHLKTHWPFDEVDALVTEVMRDGQIDQNEHKKLLTVFSAFTTVGSKKILSKNILNAIGIGGISAVSPDITFEGRMFWVTGASHKASRSNFEKRISDRGGDIRQNIVKDLDYLIYCDAGNSCYATVAMVEKLRRPLRCVDKVYQSSSSTRAMCGMRWRRRVIKRLLIV